MDWAAASKARSWGASVAAADSGPTMLSFAGPSSSSAAAAAAAELHDFPIGLDQRARPAPSAARRSRAPGGGGGGGDACSVDGCQSDLSRCRDYHRRHKVCEAHSKTPVVVVGGQEQRFCQQCSRFHVLSEFDEGKKSCRKRLDGHNRRRRKPQHDSMNPTSFFSYHQANQFLVHGQTFPIADQNVNSFVHQLDRQPPFSISFSETSKTPKQFPFLQYGSSILSTTTCTALMEQSPFAEDVATTSSTCNGLTGVLDPECALSLLSSSFHPSPSGVHSATAPAQFSSSLARIAMTSQAATTAFAPDGAGGGDHLLVSGAIFEDPSQGVPFYWHV